MTSVKYACLSEGLVSAQLVLAGPHLAAAAFALI